MSYRVALPDGNIAEFPDDMPHDEAASIIKRQFYTPQEKPTSGLGSALSSGFRGGVGSAAEAVGEFSGLKGLAEFGKTQQEKAAQTYQPTSEKDIAAADQRGLLSGIGSRATQLLEPYAQAAGNITGRFGAPMLAGSVAAALAPEAVIGGAGLSAVGLGTASALAGAGATALTDLPIEIGETQLERKKAGLPSDPVKDVAYGLAKTALNTFTGHLMSGPMRGLLGKTTVEQAELLAPKVLAGELTAADASKQLTGYAQNFLRGTAENAIVGTGMMVGNTALSRSATDQSLTSPEALAAYGESAKGAIALSPMFGAYHALGQKGLGEAKLAKDEADRNAALADIRNQQAANEQAKLEFQKTQPDYLDRVQSDYMAAEQQKLDLLNQKRTVEAGSLTETADRLHNKDIDTKVKELQPTIESLAAEFNKYRPAPPKATESTKVTEATPEQVAAQTAADKGEAPRDIEPVDTTGLDKNNDYVAGLINDLNLTVEQRDAITGNNLLSKVGKLGLNQSDWVDVGSLPTFAKGKGGKGTSIADRVSNGEFDQWLPDKLKSEIIKDDTDKQQEAEEFIKDALRQHGLGQPFYDTETREALRQNEIEVTRIEQELDRESNIDEINGEIQDLADELAKEEHGNREPAEFGVEPEGEAGGAAEGEGANAPEAKLTEPAAEPIAEPAAEPETFEPKPIDTSKLQDVLSRALLPTLKRFGLEDVGLKFIENAGNFDGEYTKKLIKIALDAARPLQALRHEAIHALKDMGFFTPGQWKLLENQADKVWIDKYLKNRNVDGKALKEGEESRFDAYSKLYKGDMDAIREEAIADAFADFDAHGAPKGIMATLTAKLQDFFAKVKQAFKSGGYESAEDVFKQIEAGKLTATAEKPTATAAKASIRSLSSNEKQIVGSSENPEEAFGNKMLLENHEKSLDEYNKLPPDLQKKLDAYRSAERKARTIMSKSGAVVDKSQSQSAITRSRNSFIKAFKDSFGRDMTYDESFAHLNDFQKRIDDYIGESAKPSLRQVTDLNAERASRKALDQEGESLFHDLQTLISQGRVTPEDMQNLKNSFAAADNKMRAAYELNKIIRSISRRPAPDIQQTPEQIQKISNAANDAVSQTGEAQAKPSLRTNTPEFKQWFGNSKVVDEDGKPLVVYHGSPNFQGNVFVNEVDRKNNAGNVAGYYFAPSAEEASRYALDRKSDAYQEGSQILPVYLSIKKPYIAGESRVSPAMIDQYKKELIATNQHMSDEKVAQWAETKSKYLTDGVVPSPTALNGDGNAMQRVLKAGGYDGFKDGRHWVAFESNQIKSATGNRGTYDVTNPDIRKSLRTESPEFKQFFGDSKIVDANGEPTVLYHGLAKDTASFARKTERGSPIFLTDNPKFAEGFSKDSFAWMSAHADQFLTPQQLDKAKKQAIAEIRKDYRQSPSAVKEMVDSLKSGKYEDATGEAQDYLRKAYKDMLQSGPHIMPLYVRAEKPFDYENPADVKAVLDEMNKSADSYGLPAGRSYGGIKGGNWELIESKPVQDVIKKLGYDSFYVQEGGNKNLAVYDSKQLKSATGNVGAYGERPVTEAEAKPLGMTAEEANKAQAEGDVRLSLRRVESEIKSLPNGQAIYDAVRRRTTAREEQGYAERLIGGLGPTPFSYLRQKLLYQYNQLGVYGKRMVKEMGGAERLADVSAEAAALESDKAAGYVASALGTGNRMGGVPVYEKGYTKISNLNGTVKGVVEIFAPLAKYGDPEMYQAYQFWSMAKRGERLTKEGREKFTPDELAHAKELEKKYPEFVDIQKDWIKYNNGLVKYMIDTGVLSKEMGAEWMKYADYVPFYRQLEGERTIGPQIMQNLTGVKPPKKLKGPKGEESAPAADFLETITRNTQAAITSGLKNVAGQRAIDEAMFLGQAERVHNPQAAPNVLAILREGKTEHYVSADPLFIDAVKSLNLPELPFLSFLSKPADVLRSMVTKDPAFIIANMMKHSLYTYYTSGADISPITGTLKNFADVMANKSPEYQTLLNAGVIGGYEFSRNIEASSQYLAKDLRAKTGTKEGLEKALTPITGVWKYLEHATEAHDAAVRISVYKDVLAKTGNEAEAIFRANEVLNFNRKGNSAMVRIVSAAIPFLNAKFQGLDLMYRGLVEPSLGGDVTARQKAVQKTGLIRAATLMGLSVMYAAMVTNDPDYEKQQQEVKDNNWIIPGLGVRIPIPFELGTLFKTMPEHIYRYFYGAEDVKELQAAGKKALMDLTFTPVPQVAMPVLEAEANYSFFTGRPIVGAHMTGIEPKFQVEPNTSIVAQKLGQMTNISPLKIDHIYQGYTGTMGMYLSDVVDSIFNTTSKPTNRFEQTPIIKRFLIDHEATGQVSQFYDLKNRVETAVRTINDLKSSGSPDLLEYAQEHGKEYAMRGQVQMVAKKLQELKKQALQIRTSDMDPDQKRDLLLENVRAQNATVGGIRQFKEALAE
jgi:hypothetical protein